MKITVIDTETIGVDPECNSVLEIAAVDLDHPEFNWCTSLVKPQHRISFGAMATHMITESMVENAPDLEESTPYWAMQVADVLVAHNAEFDRGFVPEQDARWICTYRCALHLFPDAESHRNMALAYELGLDWSDMPRVDGVDMPHRALFDAWVTRKLLIHMINHTQDHEIGSQERAVEKLLELTRSPVLLSKISFGKHRGMPWSEAPKSYLSWLVGQDFGDDVIHTARYYLR